jgi:hypothetical protein
LGTGARVEEPKSRGFTVETVEDVMVRWAVGRRFACDGTPREGVSAAGPSNGDGLGAARGVKAADVRVVSTSSSGDAVMRGQAAGLASL